MRESLQVTPALDDEVRYFIAATGRGDSHFHPFTIAVWERRGWIKRASACDYLDHVFSALSAPYKMTPAGQHVLHTFRRVSTR